MAEARNDTQNDTTSGPCTTVSSTPVITEKEEEKTSTATEEEKNKNKQEKEGGVIGRGAYHPDYADAKTLLISSKRPRNFLERTVRELLAGGTETIILSALGDAIPLCVQLQISLEEKKAAYTVKLETTCTALHPSSVKPRYTPGIRAIMKKHSEFKGLRISPGYITFCKEPNKEKNEKYTPCFDGKKTNEKESKSAHKEALASVNAGDTELYVGGEGMNRAFAEVLEEANIATDAFQTLHENLLAQALEKNADQQESKIRSVLMDKPSDIHPDVQIALCRLSSDSLRQVDPSGRMGSVFISAFKQKYPHDCPSNMAMVYVVGPKGSLFKQKEAFLKAVQSTAANLMTALCDFNGFVRREEEVTYSRVSVCRICLFSGGVYRFPEASKMDVAKAIIAGLNEAYRHGPAPRVNFSYDEDVFRLAWRELAGVDDMPDERNEETDKANPEEGSAVESTSA